VTRIPLRETVVTLESDWGSTSRKSIEDAMQDHFGQPVYSCSLLIATLYSVAREHVNAENETDLAKAVVDRLHEDFKRFADAWDDEPTHAARIAWLEQLLARVRSAMEPGERPPRDATPRPALIVYAPPAGRQSGEVVFDLRCVCGSSTTESVSRDRVALMLTDLLCRGCRRVYVATWDDFEGRYALSITTEPVPETAADGTAPDS
jgi:hypothetical protein